LMMGGLWGIREPLYCLRMSDPSPEVPVVGARLFWGDLMCLFSCGMWFSLCVRCVIIFFWPPQHLTLHQTGVGPSPFSIPNPLLRWRIFFRTSNGETKSRTRGLSSSLGFLWFFLYLPHHQSAYLCEGIISDSTLTPLYIFHIFWCC